MGEFFALGRQATNDVCQLTNCQDYTITEETDGTERKQGKEW